MKFDIFEACMFSLIGLFFVVVGVIYGLYTFILWGIVVILTSLYIFNKKLKRKIK
jgi:hypothetical protein